MVVKSRNTRLSMAELRRRRYYYLPVRFANKKILLVSTGNVFQSYTKQIRLAIETEVKIPLYKQSMQMQMGRRPQQTQTDRRIYVFDVIQDMNENEYCEVFEVVA